MTGYDSGGRVDRAPDVTLEFGHDSRSPRAARTVMKGLLDDPEDPIGDSVELVTSELVTNVVMHTDLGGVLRAWDPQPDVPLRLEVEDSDEVTAPQTPVRDVGGRGLNIVDALATDWGVDALDGGGKVVWAEFNRNDACGESGNPNVSL